MYIYIERLADFFASMAGKQVNRDTDKQIRLQGYSQICFLEAIYQRIFSRQHRGATKTVVLYLGVSFNMYLCIDRKADRQTDTDKKITFVYSDVHCGSNMIVILNGSAEALQCYGFLLGVMVA